ncbi:MAG: DUF3108 domain-containing protein [Dissulfurispiraceae bacterium]|jgi:hypothetical protein
MALLKKIITPLIVPLILSMILHGILIAGVSWLGAVDFIHDFKDTPINTLLISEYTSRPVNVKVPKHVKVPKTISAHYKRPAETSSSVIRQNGSASPELPEFMKTGALAEDASLPKEVVAFSGSAASVSADSHAAEIAAADNKAESRPAVDAPAPVTVSAAVPDQIRTPVLKKTREKLFYNLYWLNIYVGRAELEAAGTKGKVTIKMRVHSAPLISAFYKVDDYAESTVVDGMPVNFRIKQHEGKYRSDKETVFDPVRKQVTFFDYIKGTRDDHPITSAELWDLISGFYYVRTQLFKVGKNIYIDVFDSNKFFRAEVNILAKERLKLSENKEVDTLKVKPVITTEGLFQSNGDIVIWLTDDDNKTPVRIETKAPLGKVAAVLKSLETEH